MKMFPRSVEIERAQMAGSSILFWTAFVDISAGSSVWRRLELASLGQSSIVTFAPAQSWMPRLVAKSSNAFCFAKAMHEAGATMAARTTFKHIHKVIESSSCLDRLSDIILSNGMVV
jgi:hypothetical protein